MKLSVRDQKLILILLSIVIFIAAYLGVYNNFVKKTTAIEDEMAALKPRLTELQSYYDNMSTYEQGIDECREAFSAETAQYPNAVRAEDEIMYAVELEEEAGVSISSAAFSEPEFIMALRSVKENEDGSYEAATLSAYRSTMDIACTLSYPELKNMVDYINYTQNCTRLNSVSVSYDSESGELMGDMIIDKYYITGLDDEYRETYVPPMALGTDNIFGTITETEPAAEIVPEEPAPEAAAPAA
jgi:hypothetical protein